ncbi:MAG: hypothetical protein RMK20_00620 [Verrucomicrobiales bacterium]|nr:hypothetical protein [Verrucomicrobiales bacterium]
MSQPGDFNKDDPQLPPPMDLSRWRRLPEQLMLVGGALAVLGAVLNLREFGYAWLLSFMFFLSLSLGALFLVLMHHLFDAGWSVATRRFCEHIASLLFPWLFLLWIPVGLLAPKLYAWMTSDPHTDHALHAKQPLFTWAGFYGISILCFLLWWAVTNRLKHWSLRQDQMGEARCTFRMRVHSAWGVWAFALTLTLGAILWMKALQHQWFSTMYGVYYFAGSVWVTLGTVYLITLVLDRQRILSDVLHEHQFYFLGSLLFAFTVFYAYIHFSQYFIIWNGNIPEETFWYVIREQGSWRWIGLIIIFGHFFIPFLVLLRIDVKSTFPVMIPVAAWTWLMHFVDLSFNILPVPHPEGFPLRWVWLPLACMAFMGGLLARVFLRQFAAAAPFPVKDPRLIEAMGLYHPVPTQISGGELDQADELPDGLFHSKGGGK